MKKGERERADRIGRGHINLSSARRVCVKYRAFTRNMIRTAGERESSVQSSGTRYNESATRRFRVKQTSRDAAPLIKPSRSFVLLPRSTKPLVFECHWKGRQGRRKILNSPTPCNMNFPHSLGAFLHRRGKIKYRRKRSRSTFRGKHNVDSA